MKSEEEVIHSSRSSSNSYLCTESGQPYLHPIRAKVPTLKQRSGG